MIGVLFGLQQKIWGVYIMLDFKVFYLLFLDTLILILYLNWNLQETHLKTYLFYLVFPP